MDANLTQFISELDSTELIYLSTGINNRISARPISIVNEGVKIFIRSAGASRKSMEMMKNPNFAACMGYFYFSGKARSLGYVNAPGNEHIKEIYIKRYPDSFDTSGAIHTDEMFFELKIEHLSQWFFENGKPTGFGELILPQN